MIQIAKLNLTDSVWVYVKHSFLRWYFSFYSIHIKMIMVRTKQRLSSSSSTSNDLYTELIIVNEFVIKKIKFKKLQVVCVCACVYLFIFLCVNWKWQPFFLDFIHLFIFLVENYFLPPKLWIPVTLNGYMLIRWKTHSSNTEFVVACWQRKHLVQSSKPQHLEKGEYLNN